jgi:HTH-type transcriptional regulator/antitoxin HigA
MSLLFERVWIDQSSMLSKSSKQGVMRVTEISEVRPPGDFIKEELAARGWSQRDLAFILGQTEQQLSPLLSGKRAISPDMALSLGAAFEIDPAFFANLQSLYELSKARRPDPSVKTRAHLQGSFPVREMIRRGWVADAPGTLLELQISQFFEAANDSAPVAFAAKRTYDLANPAQIAWVYRVRQLARRQQVSSFQQEPLREAARDFKNLLIHPEAVEEVAERLAAVGVRLVLVEALPGARIDGVCTWLSADEPVIGISTFYDRIDNFWFVLRHEIEHVLRGDGKQGIGVVDDFSQEPSDSEAELMANRAAAEFLVPQSKMDSFFARKAPYISEKDITGFAAVLGVHPGIVVGQVQHRLGRHDYLKKYQVPVRKYLLDRVIADGWGMLPG